MALRGSPCNGRAAAQPCAETRRARAHGAQAAMAAGGPCQRPGQPSRRFGHLTGHQRNGRLRPSDNCHAARELPHPVDKTPGRSVLLRPSGLAVGRTERKRACWTILPRDLSSSLEATGKASGERRRGRSGASAWPAGRENGPQRGASPYDRPGALKETSTRRVLVECVVSGLRLRRHVARRAHPEVWRCSPWRQTPPGQHAWQRGARVGTGLLVR